VAEDFDPTLRPMAKLLDSLFRPISWRPGKPDDGGLPLWVVLAVLYQIGKTRR
jgi:hypothetical protein